MNWLGRIVRRLIDVVVALFWIILLAPVMVVIIIFIKIESPGSVLYTPLMVGQHGRLCRLWRFRTMRPAPSSTLSTEEKLTGVGRFIRNYSLDHLPMLFNLLKGDLTLVGPRPMELDVVDLQDPIWQQYFSVKPGLINYAVFKMGRQWTPGRTTKPTLNQELEVEYLHQRSWWFDAKLVWQALRAFVRSRGNVKTRGEPDAEVEERLNAD